MPLPSPSATEASLTWRARRNSSRSSVPLPSRSQRLHSASASASSTSSPSCARPCLSSPASRDRLPSLSRRRKNLGVKMGLGGWALPGPEAAEVPGVRAHLARPWMPKAPRDRHWALSLSMVASTPSIVGVDEQLQGEGTPMSFCSAHLARSWGHHTEQAKLTRPLTWPACVLEFCLWSSGEVCASCLAQLLLGTVALGTGRGLPVALCQALALGRQL